VREELVVERVVEARLADDHDGQDDRERDEREHEGRERAHAKDEHLLSAAELPSRSQLLAIDLMRKKAPWRLSVRRRRHTRPRPDKGLLLQMRAHPNRHQLELDVAWEGGEREREKSSCISSGLAPW
jgi:hypothetical protein